MTQACALCVWDVQSVRRLVLEMVCVCVVAALPTLRLVACFSPVGFASARVNFSLFRFLLCGSSFSHSLKQCHTATKCWSHIDAFTDFGNPFNMFFFLKKIFQHFHCYFTANPSSSPHRHSATRPSRTIPFQLPFFHQGRIRSVQFQLEAAPRFL